MKLTPVAKAISVAATRLGVAASVQAKSIAAEITVSPIQLAYELGVFILRVARADTVNATDMAGAVSQMFFAFFKTRTDNVQLADAIAVEFHKALVDEAGFTDAKIFDFFKALADTAGATDDQTLTIGKPLTDIGSVLEASVKAFGKALTDSAGVSDDEVMAFFKALSDSASASDMYTLETGKTLADAPALTDELYRDFAKQIHDEILVTDDWDGAASVDDDQTMVFEKQVTDLFAAADLFDRVVAFVRAFDDSAAFTDAIATETGKSLVDTGLFTDAELRFDGTKALTDDGVVVETVALAFVPAPVTDSFAVTDESFLTPGAVKTDSASLTDTGSLRSQGYCDFSYFAEDYVGASRTF